MKCTFASPASDMWSLGVVLMMLVSMDVVFIMLVSSDVYLRVGKVRSVDFLVEGVKTKLGTVMPSSKYDNSLPYM